MCPLMKKPKFLYHGGSEKVDVLMPHQAQDCPCQGGCASRRALLGDLNAHDLYCPWIRGEDMVLDYELDPQQDLVRARNYCTTIVR